MNVVRFYHSVKKLFKGKTSEWIQIGTVYKYTIQSFTKCQYCTYAVFERKNLRTGIKEFKEVYVCSDSHKFFQYGDTPAPEVKRDFPPTVYPAP